MAVYDRPEIYRQMEVYTDVTRPPAPEYSIGVPIWNEDDNSVNYSDGANWRDSKGNLT